jgi:hypothetical protein
MSRPDTTLHYVIRYIGVARHFFATSFTPTQSLALVVYVTVRMDYCDCNYACVSYLPY